MAASEFTMPAVIGVALALCVLVAAGLIRREYRIIGIGGVVVAGLAAVALALAGQLRPGLVVLGIVGLGFGVDLDQSGHRPAAVLVLAVGFVSLVAGVLPDYPG